MPKYRYTAVSVNGAEQTGVHEAPDTESLMATLRAQGLFPTRYKEIAGDKEGGSSLFKPKISNKTLSMFCTQMSAVLSAGVPISTALEIMRGQVEDKNMQKILDDVAAKLQIGRSLTEAFAAHRNRFPQMFHNMLEAGEVSGALDDCLDRAGETFTKQEKLNSKLRGAMTYPLVLLCMTAVVAVFLVAFIVPQFATVFESSGTELPGTTKFLLSLSSGLQANWKMLLAGLLFTVIGIRLLVSLSAVRLFMGRISLKIPAIGKLLTVIYSARYTRTLSAMSASGVSLTTALDVTARSMGNFYLETRLFEMIEEVKMGESMSAQLDRMKILPPLITHMTRLGEESGRLTELFDKTAQFYEDQSDAASAKLTAMLEPAVILLMGGVVLTVVLSVMQPMFSMYSAAMG